MRQLLELGFSLKDSAAALGSCRADSHLLENSVVALLEADALTKFDIGDRLPCPSAEFRGHVTVRALLVSIGRKKTQRICLLMRCGFGEQDLLRSGDYVSTYAEMQEEKWLMLILKQHGVHDATPGWAALSAAAQESLHHAYIRQTAATHPKALRQLLQLGFPLVGSCAALGFCKDKATKHVLETSVIRLLDETTPLWAPSAEFRGRVTQLLRSGRYISEDSAADKAKQQKQQTRQLLAAMQEAHVRDGTRSWSGMSATAQQAMYRHHISETANQHPEELRKLLEMGVSLGQSCAALSAVGKTKDDRLILPRALNRLLSADTLAAPSGPPADFRGRVTALLRSGAYIHIGALCRPDIGELEAQLCTSGLLSPTATPPGSPVRIPPHTHVLGCFPVQHLSSFVR